MSLAGKEALSLSFAGYFPLLTEGAFVASSAVFVGNFFLSCRHRRGGAVGHEAVPHGCTVRREENTTLDDVRPAAAYSGFA